MDFFSYFFLQLSQLFLTFREGKYVHINSFSHYDTSSFEFAWNWHHWKRYTYLQYEHSHRILECLAGHMHIILTKVCSDMEITMSLLDCRNIENGCRVLTYNYFSLMTTWTQKYFFFVWTAQIHFPFNLYSLFWQIIPTLNTDAIKFNGFIF